MQKILPFFGGNYCAVQKSPQKKCKYFQCEKKKLQTKTIFLALIIALQKSEPQIFAERKKKSLKKQIFLAIIIALRKYYRKNKCKYLQIAK